MVNDVELEKSVIGAAVMRADVVLEVGFLKPDDFYHHGDLWGLILSLHQDRKPFDLISLTAELKKKGWLDRFDGPGGITKLVSNPSYQPVENAKILQQHSLSRKLAGLSENILRKTEYGDPLEVLEYVEGQLQEINNGLTIGREAIPLKDNLRDVITAAEAAAKNKGITGIHSSLTALNRKLGGYQNGDLVIVAGRPSMGKTSLVICDAVSIAYSGVPVAFFSLEMPRLQISQRIISVQAEIELHKIKTGNMDEYGWSRMIEGIGKIRNAPLYIDDKAAIPLYELRRRVLRMINRYGIKIVFVDYLQLMQGEKKGNREQEVSSISQGLKALAKDCNIPVVALAQLSRDSEKRGGGLTPILSDLRESGAIEQDADTVIFIHRPEYYDIKEFEDGTSTAGIAELKIAKHRNGATGLERCGWIPQFTKFTNLSEMAPISTEIITAPF